MKALTLYPAYAIQVMIGVKTIELRTWKTDYRGDILITANSKLRKGTIPAHALCIAELYDIRPAKISDADAAVCPPSEITDNLYSWLLRNVRIIEPISIKGKLSLWNADVNPNVIMTANDYMKLSDDEMTEFFIQHWNDITV